MFTTSGIPGLRIIFSNCHPVRRVVWLLALSLLTAFLLKDLWSILDEYRKYPDTTSRSLDYEEGGLPLPAVTVCNANLVRKSVFCDPSMKYEVKGSRYWVDLICHGDHLSNVSVSSQEKVRKLFRFRYWLSQIRRRNKTQGQLLGHQRKDMIVGCRIGNSRDCNAEELSRSYNALKHERNSLRARAYVYCWPCPKILCPFRAVLCICPFRGDLSSGIFIRRHFTPDTKARRGNCFCLGCSRRVNETVKVDFITTPFENGVQLLLNLEIDEYIPLTSNLGLGITVHGSEVEAEFKRDAVAALPFHTTYIGVRQRITERQEPPYPDPCQREWPTEYLNFIEGYRAYCPNECVGICIQIQIWQTCGCQSDSHFILMRNGFPRAPVCDEERDNVARCVADAQSRAVRSKRNCPCLKRCFERRFLTTLSSIGWTRTLATHMTADAYKKGQRVLAKVCVYYRTTQVERIKKIPKITIHDLVAEIGSIIGLYLGLSFMLIFGVVDDITRVVVDACVNKWVQPARDRSSHRSH